MAFPDHRYDLLMDDDVFSPLSINPMPYHYYDTVGQLLSELSLSYTCRYIDRPLQYTVERRDVIEQLEGFSERQCRAFLRMSGSSFSKLLGMIAEHQVFKNNSYKEQEEVAVQLAITLDRLGHYGNGMGLKHLGATWDRSEGSCHNFFKRGLEAILSLEGRFVAWSNPEQRQEHSAKMVRKGFEGCVGFVDGMRVPFKQRPSRNGELYLDRNGQYSLNAQVVCDKNRKILFFHLGYPGGCHDHHVFCKSDLWTRSDEYFSPGQYLIADSAYPISTVTVPPFKGSDLSQDQTDFNTCIAHVRACNDHCIGMLKRRWMSLRELPVRIRENTYDADIKRALDWITACAILHNFLVEQNEVLSPEDCKEDITHHRTWSLHLKKWPTEGDSEEMS